MSVAAGIPETIVQDSVDALLREALGAARCVASSSAWSWRATDPMIELQLDHGPVTDSPRTVLLDIGAGLLNTKVLIKGRGVHPTVRLSPDPARRDLIATVRLEGQHLVTEQDRALVAAMFTEAPGHPLEPAAAATDPLITILRRAARTEQAWMAMQPLDALPATAHPPSHNGNAADRCGTALIIGTVLDGPVAWVQAGQAAQRVTLTAATQGVSVTAATPNLLDAERQRRAVRDLIGGGIWPQVVLRLETDLPETRPHTPSVGHHGPAGNQPAAATRTPHPTMVFFPPPIGPSPGTSPS